MKKSPRVVARMGFGLFYAGTLCIASGCGSGSDSVKQTTAADAYNSTTGRFRDLQLTLTLPKRIYGQDENVVATLTVKNVGSSPVKLEGSGRPSLLAISQNDKLYYARTPREGQEIAEFAPGQARTYTETWLTPRLSDGAIKPHFPGSYLLTYGLDFGFYNSQDLLPAPETRDPVSAYANIRPPEITIIVQ